jgi:hypothetical protein
VAAPTFMERKGSSMEKTRSPIRSDAVQLTPAIGHECMGRCDVTCHFAYHQVEENKRGKREHKKTQSMSPSNARTFAIEFEEEGRHLFLLRQLVQHA